MRSTTFEASFSPAERCDGRGRELRVFVPVVPEGFEWILPVDEAEGFERLRVETFESVADVWAPIPMRLLTEDGGEHFARADFPWLGEQTLVMRQAAADVIGPLVEGQAELLPLQASDAELWMLHVMEARNALDFDRSDLVQFSSGRIMTIREHTFVASSLEGVRCFKIPQMPSGSVYFTGELVEAIEAAGLSGFAVREVWSSSG